MTWDLYNFHFLETVSRQLVQRLQSMAETKLGENELKDLAAYQKKTNSIQGVYILYHRNEPVYLGKAENVRTRLAKHRKKLMGRQNVDLDDMSFKVLLLDKSMSTAANEAVLISIFSDSHMGLWNKQGFGPNDPGQNRDTTEPGDFDRLHPIKRDFEVLDVADEVSIGVLFANMKSKLPYVFRYEELPKEISAQMLDLKGVARESEALLRTALQKFPPNWHAAFVSFGIVVYSGIKAYWHTTEVIVSPNSPPPMPGVTKAKRKKKGVN